MISQQKVFGLGVALSIASAGLSYTPAVLAQDEAPATDDSVPEETTSESEEEAPSASFDATLDTSTDEPVEEPVEEEATEEPEAEEPEEELESEEGASDETTSEEDAESKSAPESDPDNAERNKAVSLVGLEMQPGSAYPSIQTRGIKYGSLWRTFHGQQWPYMPKIADEPSIRVGISGYLWNDLSNTRISVDKRLEGANVNDQNRWTTQTRGLLRLTPTYNAKDGWFVQANAEFVVQGDMRPDPSTGVLATTDDAWVRVGKWNVFDVTVGRFQAWEIANHYGMGLDWATLERSGAWIVSSSLPKPTDGYGLSNYWDRQNFLLGTYALHVYPTKYLRGELLGHVGVGNSSNASSPYQLDIRPVGIFDIGWLKLKAGWEFGKATPQDSEQKVSETKNGFGFAAQVVLDPYVEFGASFGRGFQDVQDKDEQADLAASNTVQTVGGFVNASPGHEPLVLGLGAYLNHWEDLRIDATAGDHQGKVDTNEQWLIYAAAQYTLWERFNMKFVLSHASNKVEHFKVGSYVNNAISGRFRTELLF